MSAARRLCLWTILVLSTTVATVLALELLVRALSPQAYIYPRYQYSERLAQTLLPSTEMVAALPGAWRFVYTTSEYGFRAPTLPVSNRYELPNVVVLGDSYSFGSTFVTIGFAMIVVGAVLGMVVFGPGGEKAADALETGDQGAAQAATSRLARWGVLDTLLLLVTIMAMVLRLD